MENIKGLKIKKENGSSTEYSLGIVTSVKGNDVSSEKQTGDVVITKTDIGLGKVANTADEEKTVKNVSHELTVGNQKYNGEKTVEINKNDITKILEYEPVGGQGVNLARFTSNEWSDWITPPDSDNRIYSFSDAYLPNNKDAGDKFTCLIEIEFKEVIAGSSTFSFMAQGPVDESYTNVHSFWNYDYIWLKEPPQDGIYKYSKTIPLNQDAVNKTKFNLSFRTDYWGGGKFRVRCIKVEKGTVADPIWSPAPQDILLKGKIDGRNLVLNSDKIISHSNYLMGTYNLSEPFEIGKTYTLTIYGENGKQDIFGIYSNDSRYYLGGAAKIADNFYKGTFEIPEKDYSEGALKILSIYAMPNTSSSVVSNIYKIKLEEGDKESKWTPAPEDVVTQSIFNNVKTIHGSNYRIHKLGRLVFLLFGDSSGVPKEGCQLPLNPIDDVFVVGKSCVNGETIWNQGYRIDTGGLVTARSTDNNSSIKVEWSRFSAMFICQ